MMRRLSGLQTTPVSGRRVEGSRRVELRAVVSLSHRSESWVVSAYEGLMTETTIQRPSGLTRGAPTRFISQMSSCVGGRFAADAWDGAMKQAAISANAGRRSLSKIFIEQR